MSEPRRWWIYPLEDGTLQAAPVSPTWGGGGILVEEVDASSGHIEEAASSCLWTAVLALNFLYVLPMIRRDSYER